MPHKQRKGGSKNGEHLRMLSADTTQPPSAGSQKSYRTSRLSKPLRRARHDGYGDDDTPKEFVRLMNYQKTGKVLNGLDNGDEPRGKKRKQGTREGDQAPPPGSGVKPVLQIQPGERLSDFNARVDQALPVGGLVHKQKKVEGIKERQTRHEKRLRKMQAAWREDDARIREKEAEEKELAQDEEDDRKAVFGAKALEFPLSRRQAKRKAVGSDDEDPWESLKKSREQPKGLHDVAQAPPQFQRLPQEKFKVTNGARIRVADIPSAAGSLRRREELGQTRQSIIDGYRRMMEEKRRT